MNSFSLVDDPSAWVLPHVLEEQAARRPAAIFMHEVGQGVASYAQVAQGTAHVRGFLHGIGAASGNVGLLLSNSIDFVQVWLGVISGGCVSVLFNTELRGAFLLHQLNHSGVEVLFTEADFLPNVAALADQLRHLKKIVVVNGAGSPPALDGRYEMFEGDAVRNSPPRAPAALSPRDAACIMYTSGTTGPAKGVLMPHAHCFLFGIGAIEAFQITDQDHYYISMPMFHANALLMQLGASLIAGIPVTVRKRFSTTEWLSDVIRSRATLTNLIGSTISFLISQKPTELDDKHHLRAVLIGPSVVEQEAVLRSRFGIPEVLGAYGMTEVNIPVWGRIGASSPGECGWVYRKYFDLAIVDPETDWSLQDGVPGEIVVRPRLPFGFMAGYYKDPEKTVESWRNLWFHTGDVGYITASGTLRFSDRIKDCIRRRGENISATEVEDAIAELDGIAEVAAYPVPSEIPGAEDEVMLAIKLVDGMKPAVDRLFADIDARLPRFARPRYIKFVQEDFPRTATGKVQRALLRKLGADGAFDRDRAKSKVNQGV